MMVMMMNLMMNVCTVGKIIFMLGNIYHVLKVSLVDLNYFLNFSMLLKA